MKTTLLPGDYKIVSGELNVFKTTPVKVEGETYTNRQVLIASTANLEGVKQLDRTLFVKKEDVEELAQKQSLMIASNGRGKLADLRLHFRIGFKLGYNANKGEFTKEQLMEAIDMAHTIGFLKSDETIHDIFKKIQPLSLPTSIIVDESYNIVKVNW